MLPLLKPTIPPTNAPVYAPESDTTGLPSTILILTVPARAAFIVLVQIAASSAEKSRVAPLLTPTTPPTIWPVLPCIKEDSPASNSPVIFEPLTNLIVPVPSIQPKKPPPNTPEGETASLIASVGAVLASTLTLIVISSPQVYK